MKISRIAQFKAGAAPLVLGIALFASPAFAQEAPADDAEGDIVVTGSLITNPNLEQSSPVNVTTADQIELRQNNVAEEVLRELPGVVPNIGSAVNNGNAGASFADLRGLGASRNVVLLDGQRIAPSGLQGRVDLNNIPLALIERVDSLTGAAVTTYGADAVTGVINFITRRDFAGFEISAGQQITERGDGHTLRLDATLGANFDDGRGNAVLSIGYQESDPVYQGSRAFSVDNIDSLSGAAGGSGTTVPSRFSLGAVNRVINPGTGLLQSGFVPFNFNPFNIFQTPFERFNIYAQGNYEISDSVEVYTRALFSRNSVSTIIAPSGIFASEVTIPVSNPYLPLGAAQQFCAANDFNPTLAGIQTISAAECAAARTALTRADPNYREFTTVLRRRTVETGTRNSEYATTIFDYSLGVRGAISETVDWDLRGSYGESENIQTITGYVLTSRVRDALLATNTTTCLSAAASCIPINVFGDVGSLTPAQAASLLQPSTTTVRTSLAQVRGTVSGDLGVSLSESAEPIGFAFGGEYRRYQASQVADSLAQIPGELGGAGGAADPIDGGYDVYEVFGEVIVPILADRPLFHSLTLEGGARYSAYTVDAPGNPTNNTFTWKIGGSWEPVEAVKLRGAFSRAVRAPMAAKHSAISPPGMRISSPLRSSRDLIGFLECMRLRSW
ncbi:MAG: TonB-dependent receptor [Sphingomonadales bacterium]|nr:TonB-dependent receptor [Sphingomonadales bacterium]